MVATTVGWITPLGSVALGLLAGGVGWFVANYYGRSLKKFWDLRSDVHRAIAGSAWVRSEVPYVLAKADESLSRLDSLGIEIDTFIAVMPRTIVRILGWCGCDLHGASKALNALSDTLGRDNTEAVCHRVKAQQALHLPIDPEELDRVERYRRIENFTF